ncbi:phosphoenolpyruvate-protein phosphotransferase PtsI [Buchnera aphidicola (Ceratoglyphina bambusae)]|uniref:phosphoenolpyruvate-protein phosphotransferase PtsI n=1 Tax=Buchnera aphidicola TaxID=9 RepID=UPI0031B7EC74
MISGISVSPGIVLGKALLIDSQKVKINKKNILKDEIKSEIKNFFYSKEKTIKQIKNIKKEIEKKLGKEKSEIFEGHIMILEDKEFEKDIITLIKKKQYTSEISTKKIIKKQIKEIKKLNNTYLKNRALDIKDIGNRLIKNILKINIKNLNKINKKVIIISKDLTPSETAQINIKNVLGFITELGGETSHTSIIAKSLGIPAIAGAKNVTKKIKNNDYIILDSINNEIYVNPKENIIKNKKKIKKKFLKKINKLKFLKNLKARTIDGKVIKIGANISNTNDIKIAKKNGAELIGLYRTEFLFMNRNNFPTENEQFESYKKIAKKMKNKEVIIRTLDIGGDKDCKYMKLPREDNPFLGYRAIRILMKRKDILRTQLKAILRASYFGQLKIMFPMIISLQEIRFLKKEVKKVKISLKKENINFNKNIKIGVMIETPAAALISNELAKEVDFFSIGSNDLTQYTLAVDRGNDLVSHLYNPMHPAVIKLIKKIVKAAHSNGKWVGLCGELASNKHATQFLIGIGIDELSMNSPSIPIIKKIIRKSNLKNAKKIVKNIL